MTWSNLNVEREEEERVGRTDQDDDDAPPARRRAHHVGEIGAHTDAKNQRKQFTILIQIILNTQIMNCFLLLAVHQLTFSRPQFRRIDPPRTELIILDI